MCVQIDGARHWLYPRHIKCDDVSLNVYSWQVILIGCYTNYLFLLVVKCVATVTYVKYEPIEGIWDSYIFV